MNNEPRKYDFYTRYTALIESMSTLVTTLRQNAVPEREVERFVFPTSQSMDSYPEPFCDYVDHDKTLLAVDFIREQFDTDTVPHPRSALELISTGIGGDRTIYVTENATGGYDAHLVKDGAELPEFIGTCTHDGVAKLLLPNLGISEGTIANRDLSGADILLPERSEGLRSGAEAFGHREYVSKLYRLGSDSTVIVSEEGPTDQCSDFPGDIHVNLGKRLFEIDISTQSGFKIVIKQDGVEILQPEQLLINEIIEMITAKTVAVAGDTRTVELPVSPTELDNLGLASEAPL